MKHAHDGRTQGTPRTGDRRRVLNEIGQVGGIEAVIFGLLVLVGGTLIVANAWGVVDARMAVSTAARDAARAYVKAPAGSDAETLALTAARDTLTGLGRDASSAKVELVAGSLVRCARVTIRVRISVPAIRVPWIGAWGNGFVVAATRSEIVDPYRSGLHGTGPGGGAVCAAA